VADLAIKDLAEQTGLAAGTIRMWEQRYGFPRPRRTPTGHRRYSPFDVSTLKRAIALRESGLSVPAALQRAREVSGASDRPSIYAAVAAGASGRPRLLRKRTLLALSRAIEDETLAHAAAPVCFAAFQRERFFRSVEHRYKRIAALSDTTGVFADFSSVRHCPEGIAELPIAPEGALESEWAVIVDAPGYAACLLAWERPGREEPDGVAGVDRRFESFWSLEPLVVREAALAAVGLAERIDAEYGRAARALLEDRPLATESPAPALTALTNRAISYLEGP